MPRNTARGTRLCLVSCCAASDEIDGPIVRDPKQPGFELPGVIELIEFSVSLE